MRLPLDPTAGSIESLQPLVGPEQDVASGLLARGGLASTDEFERLLAPYQGELLWTDRSISGRVLAIGRKAGRGYCDSVRLASTEIEFGNLSAFAIARATSGWFIIRKMSSRPGCPSRLSCAASLER